MIDSFLGEKIDFWITLRQRANELDVSDLIREIAQLKAALQKQPQALRYLLAAVDEMDVASRAEHPDETVQWAIDELSEDGHAYVFGTKQKVLNAYRAWKPLKYEL